MINGGDFRMIIDISKNPGPDLHRPSDPLLDAVRLVEGAPGGGRGAQAGLPGRIGRSGG